MSLDVGVNCAAEVGDTIQGKWYDEENDVWIPATWTVVSRRPINIWSPRKPIYSTKITALTADDWKGTSRTLSGYKTGGGIKKAIVTGQEYINSIISGTGGNVPSAIWTHDKPILDGVCAFRITDFEGYWHTAGRMFNIGTIYGNIDRIIVPSSGNVEDIGSTIGFSMYFSVVTGTITAQELFGDCKNPGAAGEYFYPGVIMTCGGDYKYSYVKTADHPISYYFSNSGSIGITINTRLFMNKMISIWSSSHSGDPYSSFPFRTGDSWTACLVLISRRFDGGLSQEDASYAGGAFTLNNSDNIIRLEYAAPVDGVYVDRRTLPLKQSKYLNIEWIKMKVWIQRYTSDRTGYDCYKIRSIIITAKMLTTAAVSFRLDATLSAYIGVVTVPGYAQSGQSSVEANSYIATVAFSGTVGEVQKEYTLGGASGSSIPETTFYIQQSAGSGNKNCNATFELVDSKGSFNGVFHFDVYYGNSNYETEHELS
jgi:hypothetical protein